MIYPTRRAIVLVAAGVPLALALGALAPGYWVAGPAWVLLLVALGAADLWLGPSPSAAQLTLSAPGVFYVGADAEAFVAAQFDGPAPRSMEISLETNPRLSAEPSRAHVSADDCTAAFQLRPRRRGEALLSHGWIRWRGPLGLVWKQARRAFQHTAPVVPNIQSIREEPVRLFARESMFGLKAQIDSGEGAEFHALTD